MKELKKIQLIESPKKEICLGEDGMSFLLGGGVAYEEKSVNVCPLIKDHFEEFFLTHALWKQYDLQHKTNK